MKYVILLVCNQQGVYGVDRGAYPRGNSTLFYSNYMNQILSNANDSCYIWVTLISFDIAND